MVRIATVISRVIDLIAIACVGGLLNRARGGWLDLSQLSYDAAHILPRLAFALPTGALASFVSRRSLVGRVVFLSTMVSLYIGWGAYMSLGHTRTGLVRNGVFDWLLGTIPPGETFTAQRALFRDFAGMSLRGLLWTGSGGYALYHMGYGWQYALSGTLMGPVYAISFHTQSTILNFENGTPAAEFFWGIFVWLALLSSLTARHTHANRALNEADSFAAFRRKIVPNSVVERFLHRAFEVFFGCWSAMCVASCVFYGQVDQSDAQNWSQTQFGVIATTVILLMMQVFQALIWYRSRGAHLPLERAPLINTREGSAFAALKDEEHSPVLRWLWPTQGAVPFLQVRTVVGLLAVVQVLATLSMTVVAFVQNINTPRYVEGCCP